MATSVLTRIYRGTPRNIAQLGAALKRGELVAVPTETVYGLAGDALNPKACQAIFRAKGRPSHDPLIVHIYEHGQLDALAVRNAAADRLAAAFWPGPLTLVLPKKPSIPDVVTSGQPSVAVRMPRHPLFRKLLRACGLALAAPSANPFGYISPTTAAHVQDGLGGKIRFILDGGPAAIGVESTILDLRRPSRPTILRPGAIDRTELERVLGQRVFTHSRREVSRPSVALAPGMLSKHYSPRTPVILHRRLRWQDVSGGGLDDAFLFTERPQLPKTTAMPVNVHWLSLSGELSEAAHTLFSKLRQLDRGKWATLHVELAPGKSALALAINDRLTRAAAKR